MTAPRLAGSHHHLFDNVADVLTDDATAGDVLTIGTPGQPPIWAPPASIGLAVRTYLSFGSTAQTYTP